jgi:hypothetical protein
VWAQYPALASTALVARGFAEHATFPTTDELSALMVGQVSASGAPIVFERQTKKTKVRTIDQAYDARIYAEGRVPTRERSWHDLFNALVWAAFPKTKRAVNARQLVALRGIFEREQKMPGARTREQDALAMFDEGGVLLVTTVVTRPQLDAALAEVDRAALVALVQSGGLRTLLFGHGLAEHFVSSDALVRGLPVCVTVDAWPTGADALDDATLFAQVDAVLATIVEGPFARGDRWLAGVPALPLWPELFVGAPPSATKETLFTNWQQPRREARDGPEDHRPKEHGRRHEADDLAPRRAQRERGDHGDDRTEGDGAHRGEPGEPPPVPDAVRQRRLLGRRVGRSGLGWRLGFARKTPSDEAADGVAREGGEHHTGHTASAGADDLQRERQTQRGTERDAHHELAGAEAEHASEARERRGIGHRVGFGSFGLVLLARG